MAAVECRRTLSGGLAAAVLSVSGAMLVAGCIAGDETTVTFDAATTLAPPSSGDDGSEARSDETSTTADGQGVDATGGPADGAEASSGVTTPTTVPLDPLLGLDAELVADGFDQPVLVTGAPGTEALYVVEREGVIKVVVDGVVAAQPFLDLTGELLSSSIEQGLLGLAFDPDFATNDRFYAYWTDPAGDSRMARFLAETPLVADPESVEVVLEVEQPAERHNAGMMQFGPDGMLYLALGDGGDGGTSAQDTSNLLGAILRLDVSGDGPAAIPAENPFGNEIWVYGLRNPWRFSIDPVDGLVFIGDVGQDRFEEINVVSLAEGAGTNFGWFEMEGDRCFRSGCDDVGKAIPALQYSHDDGCSVTGGSVYRGSAIPEFEGHYFYGDWCEGFVRSFRFANGQVVDQADWTADLAEVGQVTSFGVDNDGELYTVNWNGELNRIVALR